MAAHAMEQPKPVRIHYVLEYTDAEGRRRRKRKNTLAEVLSVRRGLRAGANSLIRIVQRDGNGNSR